MLDEAIKMPFIDSNGPDGYSRDGRRCVNPEIMTVKTSG